MNMHVCGVLTQYGGHALKSAFQQKNKPRWHKVLVNYDFTVYINEYTDFETVSENWYFRCSK